eukprot:1193574-Prorocentrum_minimum.AAC.1
MTIGYSLTLGAHHVNPCLLQQADATADDEVWHDVQLNQGENPLECIFIQKTQKEFQCCDQHDATPWFSFRIP